MAGIQWLEGLLQAAVLGAAAAGPGALAALALAGALAFGLVGAGLAAWRGSSARRRLADRAVAAEALATGREQSLEEIRRRLGETAQREDAARDRVIALEREKAGLAQALESEREVGRERVEAFRQAEQRLRESFQALSSEALDRNNERFLALAGERFEKLQQLAQQDLEQRQEGIHSLVTPIRESIGKVDESLQRVEKERKGDFAGLREQLRLVASGHETLQRETAQLVRALRTPAARGRWGEVQLRRVVEMAGMQRHCDFVEQASADTGDGRRRPDLLVQLPGERRIVVDAKAPLEAYLAAVEAEDEAEQRAHLERHARQVRGHLDALGARAYQEAFDPSPEFVVLFLPGEPFFAAALTHDPELLERGVDRKVLVAGPTTLIALLRAVAVGWREERLAESAQEVSRLGRELHDRLATLGDHFARLGQRLDGAVEAYNGTVGSLESRVLVTARRFRELGAAGSREIPAADPVEARTRSLAPPDGSR